MKQFVDIKPKPVVVEQPKVKSFQFIMERLMYDCKKTGAVRDQVWNWLMSLQNPMTKKMFEHNMRRLSFNEDEALDQLKRSQGCMNIKPTLPQKKPELTGDILQLAVEQRRVAVGGPGLKTCIYNLVQRLKEMKAPYYVLDVEELIIQYVGNSSGNAHQMIKDAVDTDFLIMVKFETCPMLEWVVKEALRRIHRLRKRDNKITVSTWHRYNNVPDIFEDYSIFNVSQKKNV